MVIKNFGNILDNYATESTIINNKAGIKTIYNKKYKLYYKIEGDLQYGRPYHILLFKNLIFINVHFPHKKNAQQISCKILNDGLNYIIDKYNIKYIRVILCGDFNNRNPLVMLNKNIEHFIFYESSNNRTFKTNRNGSIDHIFDTQNSFEHYKTLDTINASDHNPVFAII